MRRTLTNTSATQTVRLLRLRLTSITTYGNTTASQATLAAYSSSDETVSGQTVEGVTLDRAADQPDGGGLNSSWTVPLPDGGLAPGQSINISLLFHAVRGVRGGTFSFGYNAEATTTG
ncbi:MAG TPA: hypothetical protein VGI87_12525 [Solirubrobacteraceae bacterium]